MEFGRGGGGVRFLGFHFGKTERFSVVQLENWFWALGF